MTIEGPLLLVGCGKMGSALLSGWLQRGLRAEEVTLVEPNPAGVADFAARGARVVPAVADLPPDYAPKLVVLAVKPQMMDQVMAPLTAMVRPATLFLSIAAGKTLDYFRHHLGESAAVVRAMPNTPAAVGRGMSVLVASAQVTAGQRDKAGQLMAAAGETAWVEDEALIDVVTAVSGGGPAYVFLLAEVLAEAGRANGLPGELADRLARVTVAGSGELLHRASESPAVLRQNVTSPGGTTLEALKVLMAEDALQPLVNRAIAAATRRSRELAG